MSCFTKHLSVLCKQIFYHGLSWCCSRTCIISYKTNVWFFDIGFLIIIFQLNLFSIRLKLTVRIHFLISLMGKRFFVYTLVLVLLTLVSYWQIFLFDVGKHGDIDKFCNICIFVIVTAKLYLMVVVKVGLKERRLVNFMLVCVYAKIVVV